MAKSIFTQLTEGYTDIDHAGETLRDVELPKWLAHVGSIMAAAPTQEAENTEIIDYLNQHGLLTGFLALACQQSLVGVRSVSRPADKAGGLKGEKYKVSILADKDAAFERALAYVPNALHRPKAVEKSAAEVMASMKAEGKTDAEIVAHFMALAK